MAKKLLIRLSENKMQSLSKHKNLKDARILITNDDGYEADGIKLLTEIVEPMVKEVWVIAPSKESSGSGHSLTVRRNIDVVQRSDRKFSVDGTPTDCVILALNQIMESTKPDLVLSGINCGVNIAEDITYSGTVGAAYEATIAGVRAIALSQELSTAAKIDWSSARENLGAVIQRLYNEDWKPDCLLNVNFPKQITCEGQIKFSSQGRHKEGDEIALISNYNGKRSYRIGAVKVNKSIQKNSDIEALKNGCISVTPISINHTDTAFKNTLENQS